MILDASRSADENFNSLLCKTKKALDEAIGHFVESSTAKSVEEGIARLKYDYESLFTTVVGEVLHMLSFTYTENMKECEAIATIPIVDSNSASQYDTNRKRVSRIMDSYIKRNKEHAEYLISPDFEPQVSAADALWYDLLSEFPILKRFLHNKEPIITKKFFDDLNLVYDKIDEYGGYEKFFLMHRLEKMSKLEMFYKVLALIKEDKRRRNLSEYDVEILLKGMSNLHLIPYNWYGVKNLWLGDSFPPVYNEILLIFPFLNTISSIVFNTDSLIAYYISKPDDLFDAIEILNLICNAVILNVCCKIEEELSPKENMTAFELIKDIQECYTATNFFDEYMDSHNLVNRNKNCSEDITFTHFKRVYMLKKEKQYRKSDKDE